MVRRDVSVNDANDLSFDVERRTVKLEQDLDPLAHGERERSDETSSSDRDAFDRARDAGVVTREHEGARGTGVDTRVQSTVGLS